MGRLKGICISEKRGTEKHEVREAMVKMDWGIEGDAHGGKWHRQISLLSDEKIQEFRAKGAEVAYKRMGDCIMPREGVFAEVVTGGHIKVGDEVVMEQVKSDRPFSAAVITLSDKGAAGEREDKSGPMIVEMLKDVGYDIKETILLPDEQKKLEKELIRLADQRQLNVIFTTGGTGFSERDRTPEATVNVCDRMANGIAEAIRNYSMTITKRAMFSRAVSGIRKKTLIINLPGSPKAVQEALEFLLPELGHGLGILRGTEGECARK